MFVVILLIAVGLALALRRPVRRGRDGSATASALLAPPARAWFDAMRAEYAVIDDPRERRRFARGCVAALTVGPVPSDRTGSVMKLLIAAAGTAAAALGAYGLVRYPGLRSGPWLAYVAGFAAALCVCVLLGNRLALLGTPRARRLGLLAAVPAAGLAAVAAEASGVLSLTPALLLPALPALGGLVAARRDDSVGSGVAAAGTCAILAGLLAFVGFVTVTYAIDGGSPTPALLAQFHQSGMHDYATWAIGDDLGGAVFILGFVLAIGAALGAAAASLAAPHRQRRSDLDATPQ